MTRQFPTELGVLGSEADELVQQREEQFDLLEDVLRSLDDAPGGSLSVKAKAQQLARIRGPNVKRLNEKSRALTFAMQSRNAQDAATARRLAEAAVAVMPESPGCLTSLAMALVRQGNYVEAINVIERAASFQDGLTAKLPTFKSLTPYETDSVIAQLFLAIACHHLGEEELAQDSLAGAVSRRASPVWPAMHEIDVLIQEVQTLPDRPFHE